MSQITTPSAVRRQERATLARELLVATADELYNSRGFQFVVMDDLREATGLSLRAMYDLYPSKTELVLAVLDRRHKMWTEGLTVQFQHEPDAQRRLLVIYDYLAGWFEEGTFRGCGFINAFAELGAAEPAIADRVRNHKNSFQQEVARLVNEAHANPELAPQLAILAEGAQTTAAIAGNSAPAAHARKAALVLIRAALPAS